MPTTCASPIITVATSISTTLIGVGLGGVIGYLSARKIRDRKVHHSDKVIALLAAIDADTQSMLRLGAAIMDHDGAPAYFLDTMALGAIKRNVSTASAMVSMVSERNMICARTLLRTHIDTSLRFSAAWLVDDPHDFALRVLRGDRIDHMKDRQGEQLRDAYLVEARAAEYPWLRVVYNNLSGYVHFSHSHIAGSIAGVDDETQTVRFEISTIDLDFPDSSWIEVLKCFREATEFLAKYLHGYISTKSMSPKELQSTEPNS